MRQLGELDKLLDDFAGRLIDCAETGYIRPFDFLAIGGRKLFRDEVWSSLRLAFRADHRYYRRTGCMIFPSEASR